ncbi:MAG: indolepyruvate oxidoreductase subunit beta [Deltaproteobacteria bacterium]|nr:indolepyruvate oxidoreductase subunit beta [Deltaproteobacteria bacterium]MBW2123219.1 indolepyruvate oxidoreductase subunit beta [Deltaproteobacteria bacterium]
MENEVTNILLVGVGGQGIIVASDIMTDVFLEAGYDVKKSEIHGMAQRGGSVTSHVRFGKKVYSPIIKQGDADILLAFERLEALRWVNHLRGDGTVVMNDHKINPPAVNLGQMSYPERIEEILEKHCGRLHVLPATRLAEEAGDIRSTNVVLLGALSHLCSIREGLWIDVILKRLPPKVHSLNQRAFSLGRRHLRG